MITEDEIAAQIIKACADAGYKACPACRKPLAIMMITWNNAFTPSLDDYVIECICDRCQTVIFRFEAVYTGIEDWGDLLVVIEADLPHKPCQ